MNTCVGVEKRAHFAQFNLFRYKNFNLEHSTKKMLNISCKYVKKKCLQAK